MILSTADQSVDEFAADAPQFDDLTCVLLTFIERSLTMQRESLRPAAPRISQAREAECSHYCLRIDPGGGGDWLKW